MYAKMLGRSILSVLCKKNPHMWAVITQPTHIVRPKLEKCNYKPRDMLIYLRD